MGACTEWRATETEGRRLAAAPVLAREEERGKGAAVVHMRRRGTSLSKCQYPISGLNTNIRTQPNNMIEILNILIAKIHRFIHRSHTRHHTMHLLINIKFEAITVAIVAKCPPMPPTQLEAEASVESGILQLLMAQGENAPSMNQCLFFF